MERATTSRYGPGARFGGARSRRGGVPTTLPPSGRPAAPRPASSPSPSSCRRRHRRARWRSRCPASWWSRTGSTSPPSATSSPTSGRWARPRPGLRHPRMPTGPRHERAIGVPRLALAAVRLQPHGRRHRRRPGQADAAGPRRPRPAGGRRRLRRRQRRGRDVRTRRRPRQPVRPGRPPRPAPGRRRGARRAGRDDQHRRHLHVPVGRGRPPHGAVRGRRAAQRRPARVRAGQPAHLPRRAQGAGRRPRPPVLDLPPGRLSITVRQTGLG